MGVSRTAPASTSVEIDDLIRRWQCGDMAALDSLLPLVYADLRAMAARLLGSPKGQVTLQPTALVNDVLVRVLEAKQLHLESGPHLFNSAARIMRRILIDRMRHASAAKHGGGSWERVDIREAMQLPIPDDTKIELLDAAVDSLERVDERLARIVELRYFVGLSVAEVAVVLGVDERTVYRDWALARIWLQQEMER